MPAFMRPIQKQKITFGSHKKHQQMFSYTERFFKYFFLVKFWFALKKIQLFLVPISDFWHRKRTLATLKSRMPFSITSWRCAVPSGISSWRHMTSAGAIPTQRIRRKMARSVAKCQHLEAICISLCSFLSRFHQKMTWCCARDKSSE